MASFSPRRQFSRKVVLATALFLSSGGGACGGTESSGGAGGAGPSVSSAGTGGGTGGSDEPPRPDPAGWRPTASLSVARVNHTATLLLDGRVLVAGGETNTGAMIADVETFDPTTETWTTLPSLPEPRSNHTATLLADGRVLLAGGGKSSAIGVPSPDEVLGTCLLFDPKDNSFSPVSSLAVPRSGHRAALLDDGRVLVVGGGADTAFGPCGSVPNCTVANALASTEVFDAATGQWSGAGPMAQSRLSFTLTSLSSGVLLAVGGASGVDSLKTSELFLPDKMAWIGAPSLQTQDRLYHAAALLGSGHVLVAGGKKSNVSPLDSVEIFDPAVPAWTPTTSLSEVRTATVMLPLPTGRVIAVGGYDQLTQKALDLAEIFDEESATWSAIAPLAKARVKHSVTTLADGRLLVAGGSSGLTSTKSCEMSE